MKDKYGSQMPPQYQAENQLCATDTGHGLAVSGSRYCDDCTLQHQVNARHKPAPGTLATLIREGLKQGLIAPVKSGYQHA